MLVPRSTEFNCFVHNHLNAPYHLFRQSRWIKAANRGTDFLWILMRPSYLANRQRWGYISIPSFGRTNQSCAPLRLGDILWVWCAHLEQNLQWFTSTLNHGSAYVFAQVDTLYWHYSECAHVRRVFHCKSCTMPFCKCPIGAWHVASLLLEVSACHRY